ncbi:MAG: PKD domain-containing protein, partial [Myxococcota bacterium]|nr:PKD domain-containing protein [Myxococcota bacterium]
MSDTVNTPPVSDAGEDQVVSLGEAVELDGSGSYDDDGDTLSWWWRVVSTPEESLLGNDDLSDRTAEEPSFEPDVAGEYELRLRVSDGTETDTDTVVITVEPSADTGDTGGDTGDTGAGNNTPVADAGEDQVVVLGEVVTLDGTASYDVDGDELDYRWVLVSIPGESELISLDV